MIHWKPDTLITTSLFISEVLRLKEQEQKGKGKGFRPDAQAGTRKRNFLGCTGVFRNCGISDL